MLLSEERIKQLKCLNDQDFISFKFYLGDENEIISRDVLCHMDYRLFRHEYLEHAITIEMSLKKSKEKLGYTTFYMLSFEVYREIFFWKLDNQKNVLVKEYLNQYKDEIGDRLLLLAFGRLKQSDTNQDCYIKYRAMNSYIKVYNILKSGVTVLGEPTGLYQLDRNPELLKRDYLSSEDIGGFDNLGETYFDSKAALELTKFLGLQIKPGVYHAETLGSIYMKIKQ